LLAFCRSELGRLPNGPHPAIRTDDQPKHARQRTNENGRRKQVWTIDRTTGDGNVRTNHGTNHGNLTSFIIRYRYIYIIYNNNNIIWVGIDLLSLIANPCLLLAREKNSPRRPTPTHSGHRPRLQSNANLPHREVAGEHPREPASNHARSPASKRDRRPAGEGGDHHASRPGRRIEGATTARRLAAARRHSTSGRSPRPHCRCAGTSSKAHDWRELNILIPRVLSVKIQNTR
jgi:hypothetical protein